MHTASITKNVSRKVMNLFVFILVPYLYYEIFPFPFITILRTKSASELLPISPSSSQEHLPTGIHPACRLLIPLSLSWHNIKTTISKIPQIPGFVELIVIGFINSF